MTNSFRKILVAGGGGFVGKNVVEKLKEKKFEFSAFSLADGWDFRDFNRTKDLLDREKPDAVINCAAFVGGIQFGIKRQGEIFFNNILISTYLMEASRLAGVKRFVNPISNCTYPANLTNFREEDWWSGPFHESVLAYGMARKASWVQGWAYKKQYGFDSLHLILPSMYGPFDGFDEIRSHALTALIMKFVEAKRNNSPEVIVWGTGSPIREWLFVEDGAEFLLRALRVEPFVEPINVGRGEGISILALAELIKEIVGYKGRITLDKTKPDGVACKVSDVAKMQKVFNWFPPTGLEEGLRKTISWYENNVK